MVGVVPRVVLAAALVLVGAAHDGRRRVGSASREETETEPEPETRSRSLRGVLDAVRASLALAVTGPRTHEWPTRRTPRRRRFLITGKAMASDRRGSATRDNSERFGANAQNWSVAVFFFF